MNIDEKIKKIRPVLREVKLPDIDVYNFKIEMEREEFDILNKSDAVLDTLNYRVACEIINHVSKEKDFLIEPAVLDKNRRYNFKYSSIIFTKNEFQQFILKMTDKILHEVVRGYEKLIEKEKEKE